MSLASITVTDIHQRLFCHQVLTYKGAVLQYHAGSPTSGHKLCSWDGKFYFLHRHWAMSPHLPLNRRPSNTNVPVTPEELQAY